MAKKECLHLLKQAPVDFNDYFNAIIDSLGSEDYRQYFVEIDGQKIDLLENGQLSCAHYVSNVLLGFALVKEGHCTVISTIKDMLVSGWQSIKEPRSGSVLLWEKQLQASGRVTIHIGFYIMDGLAISHRDDIRAPRIHHWTYGTKEDGTPVRKVQKIYWHDRLR